jgi:hypothetical protein
MRRFSSLKFAPAGTRLILRDRFVRYLPIELSAPSRTANGGTVSDESLLQLLLNLSIVFESDLDRARATYEAARPLNAGEPSFDDVIAAGWIRVIWGRIAASFEFTRAARSAPAEPMTALASLLAMRFKETYLLSDDARNGADLKTVVAAIESGDLAPHTIRSQDPQWVGARLWDRSLAASGDHFAELRLWVDRWRLLGAPSLVPGQAWSENAAETFRDTAIEVVKAEPSLVGWQEIRSAFVKQMAIGIGQPLSNTEQYIPSVPAAFVDRVLWLDDNRLERSVMGVLGTHNDILGLVRLLLADVEAEQNAQAPHKMASRLITLALDRAELFLGILFKVRWSPVLLADLLLYPATAAVACLLIAQWRPQSGAWDRELRDRDDQTTKTIAFADAVSVMGHFLEQGSLPPKEAASLLNFLHKTAKRGFIDDLGNSEPLLVILRGELGGQSTEIQQAMFAELSSSMPQAGLGTSTFAAALDIVDAGKLAGTVDPVPLVSAYIQSVAAGKYTLSANRISISGAASLVELAMNAASGLRQSFFSPIDIRAGIAAASAPDANPYTVTDTIARSIRAHVRVLSRAVAGLMESTPDELANALIEAVRAGALSHPDKGRVAAFSARYEVDPFRGSFDRPIAADLGAALTLLIGEQREQLLLVVMEIDEPMVLAQLLSLAPHEVRPRIERRVKALAPSDAGDIHSLPEAQKRIDELLSAGLPNEAAKYIEVEQGLKTWGKTQGRELARLRTALQLKLLRRDWTGIADAEPPPDLSLSERDLAVETINFYNALAELSDPAGDRQGAERLFASFQQRHPDVAAYPMNLFAVRITLLLGSDLFGQLHGAALVRGRQIMEEAEQSMLRVRTVSASDSEIFSCNKALILLAMGQPDQANDILASLQTMHLYDRAAAYTAIAVARMGRVAEAIAGIDQAEKVCGSTDVLQAARAHIRSGKRFAATANVSRESDPILGIKTALWDFSRLNHQQQAEVLQQPPPLCIARHRASPRRCGERYIASANDDRCDY